MHGENVEVNCNQLGKQLGGWAIRKIATTRSAASNAICSEAWITRLFALDNQFIIVAWLNQKPLRQIGKPAFLNE